MDHAKCATLFWGNHWYDPTSRRVTSKQPSPTALSFFAQAVVRPIHDAYRETCDVAALAQRLKVDVSSRDTGITVLARWRPLSAALTDAVVTFLPTPIAAQSNGLAEICPRLAEPQFCEVARGVAAVSADGPTLAFAPKIVHGGLLHFPPRGSAFPFVAYVRVYSGTIRIGDQLFVSNPRTGGVSPLPV
jgi:translation elongation factor EF-G